MDRKPGSFCWMESSQLLQMLCQGSWPEQGTGKPTLHFSISCSGNIWGPTDLSSRARKQKLSWSGGGWEEKEERTNGNLAPPQQFSRNTHASQCSCWPLFLSASPTGSSLPSMLASQTWIFPKFNKHCKTDQDRGVKEVRGRSKASCQLRVHRNPGIS